MFGGNFAPDGWAFCNGQLLQIADYEALFSLIGTTYGGDGQTNFALPNLQGCLAVHQGAGFSLGEIGGSENVTLTVANIPMHSHNFNCSTSPGAQKNPAGNVPAAVPAGSTYVQQPATAAMAPQSIQPYPPSGSQPHNNMQPFQCVAFILSLFGIYPTQN